MQISINQIKKLRQKTGAGIADCRKALEDSAGNLIQAQALLKNWGIDKAVKKEGRTVGAGLIETYIHANGRIGAMVEIMCETDFVARTDEFKKLAHELAMQVAAMDPVTVDELLKQKYIRDSAKFVDDIVKEVIAKVGENTVVRRFIRFELGQ